MRTLPLKAAGVSKFLAIDETALSRRTAEEINERAVVGLFDTLHAECMRNNDLMLCI